jgi:hypothetical protein
MLVETLVSYRGSEHKSRVLEENRFAGTEIQ